MSSPTIAAPLAAPALVGPALALPRHRRIASGTIGKLIAPLRLLVRTSRRHGLWIAAWSIVGWVGTALAPALAQTPLLLMLLSPRALFVALASDSVHLVPFVLLGTLRLGITDASYFIVGRRFPRHAVGCASVDVNSRWKRALRSLGKKGDRLCRWFCARPRLAGAFLFVRPNGKYLAIAGAYGVPAWIAGLSSAAGTACFLTAVHIGVANLF